jgi:serine protease Do
MTIKYDDFVNSIIANPSLVIASKTKQSLFPLWTGSVKQPRFCTSLKTKDCFVTLFLAMTTIKTSYESIKYRLFCFLILFVLLLTASFTAAEEDLPEAYPLPIAELEDVLSHWLYDSGYEIMRSSPEAGQVLIHAIKGKEIWRLSLKSNSPLSSYLQAGYTFDGRADQLKLGRMKAYLDDYCRGLFPERKISGHAIPSAVLDHMESVFCIKAVVNDDPVRFSGFLISRKGLIISTAHDLEGVKEMVIILEGGQELRGRLVKIDFSMDLALISINSAVSSPVSLKKSSSSLRNGDKVYAVGCPMNERKSIHSGTIDGPVRWVNNMPILQVDMETLPGGSGSPVFNEKGNLVGVVKGRYKGTNSRGFLIPLELVLDFLKKVK